MYIFILIMPNDIAIQPQEHDISEINTLPHNQKLKRNAENRLI